MACQGGRAANRAAARSTARVDVVIRGLRRSGTELIRNWTHSEATDGQGRSSGRLCRASCAIAARCCGWEVKDAGCALTLDSVFATMKILPCAAAATVRTSRLPRVPQ
jgi:hypothetical protein